MSDLCAAAIEAAEAMITLRRREEEYRRATTSARWSGASRRIAARRVRDAAQDLRALLDCYVAAKVQAHEREAALAKPATLGRRNA